MKTAPFCYYIESSSGLDDVSTFSFKRVSLGGGSHCLTGSMTSLHSVQVDATESKNTRASLTEMLLCVLQEFVNYAMYRGEL